MAFLLPLLAEFGPALAGAASALGIANEAKRFIGEGGRRRSPASMRALMKLLAARKRKGGALAVMNKWPLLSRPKGYAMGSGAAYGARLLMGGRSHHRRGGALAVMNKWPLLSRPKGYACGGGARRPRGRGPIADGLRKIPLLGNLLGPLASMFGAGHMRSGGAHFVKPHVRHTMHGPVHVRGHWAGGALRGAPYYPAKPTRGLARMPFPSPIGLQVAPARAPAGGRAKAKHRRRGRGPGTAVNTQGLMRAMLAQAATGRPSPALGPHYMGLMRKVRNIGAPMAAGGKAHFVRPHTSHTAHGRVVHVRGHWAGGMSGCGGALKAKKVKAHVRHTMHGPVHVRGHVKSGGAARRVRPHVRHTARGLVRVRGHTRGGLLSP